MSKIVDARSFDPVAPGDKVLCVTDPVVAYDIICETLGADPERLEAFQQNCAVNLDAIQRNTVHGIVSGTISALAEATGMLHASQVEMGDEVIIETGSKVDAQRRKLDDFYRQSPWLKDRPRFGQDGSTEMLLFAGLAQASGDSSVLDQKHPWLRLIDVPDSVYNMLRLTSSDEGLNMFLSMALEDMVESGSIATAAADNPDLQKALDAGDEEAAVAALKAEISQGLPTGPLCLVYSDTPAARGLLSAYARRSLKGVEASVEAELKHNRSYL